ncbi:GON-4-like protein isoform X1 [Polypterus senegalus]|uniref:GON-4-like protein isoform X1 n=1 Tax=Polypterus senegalus TaxID=55291 RepID=UPI00196420CE|nr:GON-4-like protein isoform X1 [Polypterus senegalus]
MSPAKKRKTASPELIQPKVSRKDDSFVTHHSPVTTDVKASSPQQSASTLMQTGQMDSAEGPTSYEREETPDIQTGILLPRVKTEVKPTLQDSDHESTLCLKDFSAEPDVGTTDCESPIEENSGTGLVITVGESDEEKKNKKKKSIKKKKDSSGELASASSRCDFEMDGQLDRVLESQAKQHNLTAVNVRNIIHEVIKNEHVVAMMKAAISDTQDMPLFEPKMTRSKLKEVVEKGVVIPTWNISPIKKPSELKCPQFVDIPLEEEDSSDEEYRPDEEEEDETAEETFLESDVESTASSPRGGRGSRPRTPFEQLETEEERSCSPSQGDSNVTLPQRHISVEVAPMGPPPPPKPVKHQAPSRPTQDSTFMEKLHAVEEELALSPVCLDSYQPLDESLIAFRTRSKRPLKDVPLGLLEAELQAPDITPDMYDTGTNEDKEWQCWLAGLMTTEVENEEEGDDDDDPEYNFLEDLDEPDQEDFRNDRAVRITKKEVSELMEELFETFQDEMRVPEHEDEGPEEDEEKEKPIITTKFYVPQAMKFEEPLANMLIERRRTVKEQLEAWRQRRAMASARGDSPDAPSQSTVLSPSQCPAPLFLNEQQKLQLQQQMQQHVQLLTQICMLTTSVPSLQTEANTTRLFLNELLSFAESKEMANRLLDQNFCSAFRPCNLQGSLSLLEEFDRSVQDGQVVESSPQKSKNAKSKGNTYPVLPRKVAWHLATRKEFLYPELLPQCSMDPLLHNRKHKTFFSKGEDCLLALGLKHFSETQNARQLISKYLLPGKTAKQLKFRIQKMSRPRAPENDIKFYQMFKAVRPLPKPCLIVFPWQAKPPVEREESILPFWLRRSLPYIYEAVMDYTQVQLEAQGLPGLVDIPPPPPIIFPSGVLYPPELPEDVTLILKSVVLKPFRFRWRSFAKKPVASVPMNISLQTPTFIHLAPSCTSEKIPALAQTLNFTLVTDIAPKQANSVIKAEMDSREPSKCLLPALPVSNNLFSVAWPTEEGQLKSVTSLPKSKEVSASLTSSGTLHVQQSNTIGLSSSHTLSSSKIAISRPVFNQNTSSKGRKNAQVTDTPMILTQKVLPLQPAPLPQPAATGHQLLLAIPTGGQLAIPPVGQVKLLSLGNASGSGVNGSNPNGQTGGICSIIQPAVFLNNAHFPVMTTSLATPVTASLMSTIGCPASPLEIKPLNPTSETKNAENLVDPATDPSGPLTQLRQLVSHDPPAEKSTDKPPLICSSANNVIYSGAGFDEFEQFSVNSENGFQKSNSKIIAGSPIHSSSMKDNRTSMDTNESSSLSKEIKVKAPSPGNKGDILSDVGRGTTCQFDGSVNKSKASQDMSFQTQETHKDHELRNISSHKPDVITKSNSLTSKSPLQVISVTCNHSVAFSGNDVIEEEKKQEEEAGGEEPDGKEEGWSIRSNHEPSMLTLSESSNSPSSIVEGQANAVEQLMDKRSTQKKTEENNILEDDNIESGTQLESTYRTEFKISSKKSQCKLGEVAILEPGKAMHQAGKGIKVEGKKDIFAMSDRNCVENSSKNDHVEGNKKTGKEEGELGTSSKNSPGNSKKTEGQEASQKNEMGNDAQLETERKERQHNSAGPMEEEEEEDFDDFTQDEDEEEVLSTASEESVLSVPELQETMEKLTWLASERRLSREVDSEEENSQNSQEENSEEEEEGGQKGEEESGEGGAVEGPNGEIPRGVGPPESSAKGAGRGRGESGRCAGRGRAPSNSRRRRRRVRASKDASKLLLLYDEDILEKDPLRDHKDLAFAQTYLNRVRDSLRNIPGKMEEFLQVLYEFETSKEPHTAVDLYGQLGEVLQDFPELLRDFAAFLLPEQALECGLFAEQQAFERSRKFLRQLEICFGENPSHYQKIVRVLQSGPDLGAADIEELKLQMWQLLKGHDHLQEEFSLFFDHLHPPPSSPSQFEEVTWTEDKEYEFDGFEEVTLPDLEEEEEPVKISGPRSKRRKDLGSTNNDKDGDWSEVKDCICHELGQEGKLRRHRRKTCPRCHPGKGLRNKELAEVSTDSPSGPLSPRLEAKICDKQMDLTDGDICTQEAEQQTHENPLGVSEKEVNEEEKLDNLSLIPQPFATQTDAEAQATNTMNSEDFSVEQTLSKRTDCEERLPSDLCSNSEPVQSLGPASDACKDPAFHGGHLDLCNSSLQNQGTSGDPEVEKNPSQSQSPSAYSRTSVDTTVCAKNITVSATGEKVILWTREADRVILTNCQQLGANQQSFQSISEQLGNKTSTEVSQRFQELMRLFHTASQQYSSDDEDEGTSTTEQLSATDEELD